MNAHRFLLAGVPLAAFPSGALWVEQTRTLVVSDLHLGKSERIARRAGVLLPPYETAATLDKLSADLIRLDPTQVICLGDSFDDLGAAEALRDTDRSLVHDMQNGRDWLWVEGNHDPGPPGLGGSAVSEVQLLGLTLRHIADPAQSDEISGHYHPKHRLAGRSRPAFLYDRARVIMPAYGAYTGGLRSSDPALRSLFPGPARAVLTGARALAVPLTG